MYARDADVGPAGTVVYELLDPDVPFYLQARGKFVCDVSILAMNSDNCVQSCILIYPYKVYNLCMVIKVQN